MSRRLSAAMFYVCFVAVITVSAQSQAQSPTRIQELVLEISVVEMIGVQPDEIERIGNSREQLNRLMKEGKAKLTASLHVRTRVGEHFTARVGQRTPIQTAVFPVFRTSDEARRGASQPVQPDSAYVPQLQYEHTGLTVEGSSIAVGDAALDIRFKIEMSGLDTSTGRLTPTFTTRSLTNVVRMRQGETAIPVGLIQQEPPATSATQSTGAAADLLRGSFIVLLTTKAVQ